MNIGFKKMASSLKGNMCQEWPWALGKYKKWKETSVTNSAEVMTEFSLCIVSAQEDKKNMDKKVQGCMEQRDSVVSEKSKPPYACDEKGNFIIPKSLLKKGLYSANYIGN